MREFIRCACVALAAGLWCGVGMAQPLVVHVSPSGDDEASGGDLESAVRTLRGARDRVRTLRGAAGAGGLGSVLVTLHQGEYVLDETFVLEPQDSGAEGANVIFGARPGSRVVISGGARLGDWVSAEHGGRQVWRAELPESLRSPPGEPGSVRSLWIDGKRCTPARHPNTGYLRVRDVPDVAAGTQWHQGQTSFRFEEADAPVWSTVRPGAELVGFTRWVDTHLVVASVDAATQRAHFTRPSVFLFSPGDIYVLERAPAFLDAPDEWCIDADGAHVLYVPVKEGSKPEPGVVARVRELVRLGGRPEAGEFVEHVWFRGIVFAHASWWFDREFKATWPSPEVQGFPQAAVGVPGAIRGEGARNVVFADCRVEHVDGYGMELGRGCTGNTILACRLSDLGAGGIKIGETAIRDEGNERTSANLVADCTITGGGHIHHQAVGVWIGQSGKNTIAHNLIDGFHYTGISMGWTWGYGPALAGGNIVEFNHVRNIGARAGETEPPLGDMGGIYTLGAHQGTVIRQNLFENISGRSISWGIYFDEGTTGIVAERNVVRSTSHGGFHQHYGRENVVRNNLFTLGREAQAWKTRREDHLTFTFERNIVAWWGDGFLSGDWGGTDYRAERNIYHRMDGKAVAFPGGLDLGAWQAAGHDAGSMVADPGYRSEQGHMPGPLIECPKGSAGAAIGFQPIDLRRVGPRQ